MTRRRRGPTGGDRVDARDTGGILPGMPMTTVKVDTATRDRLLVEARREGRTIGQLLDGMLADRERAERFSRLKQAIAATPGPLRSSWAAETGAFDVTSVDGAGDA